jgi:hypothetical protein
MGETESSGGLEFANLQEQTSEWGGHPLFPRAETETGPDRRRFDIIHIQRYKGDGSREVCPKAWRGSDLRSWEQIVEAYGGGVYQLTAQCGRTYRYQAHSDRVHLAGPSKPFVAVAQSEARAPVQEMAPEPAPVAVPQHAQATPPAPVMAAPMPPPPIPPGYAQPAPYAYPYPPPAPHPAASGNAETLALIRTVLESSNAEKTTLMRALLERSGKDTGSLEVVREILPMMQGGANGTQALLQGVELARGLIGPGHHAPPPAPAQAHAEDDLALLGQVLRMIAPAAVVPAAVPAVPAASPSAPPATMAPPPAAAPPGWAWAYTASGWVLVQLAHVQPYPAPIHAPVPVAAPQPQQAAQSAAKPGESAKPSSASSTTTNPLGGIEEVLADPDVGKLFASLSALGGAA